MKRLIVLIVCGLLLGAGGAYYYYKFGGSPETRRDRALAKAREYTKLGKLNEALIEYQNAVKADPRSAQARYEFAKVILAKGNAQQAYNELVRAVDLQPDFKEARFQLGTLLLLGNDLAGAKDQQQKLRALDRNAFETRYLAAQIAIREKMPEKAVAELEEIIKKEPRRGSVYVEIGQVYLLQKDYKIAEEFFRKAIEIDPKIQGARVSLAQLYFLAGEPKKGEDELILASRTEPENETLLHILGNYYSSMSRLDEFEKLFRDALVKNPNSLGARKRLVELYLAKNDLKLAKQFTDEILGRQPGDTDGLFFRGRIYLLESNFVKALEDLSTVTQNAPNFGPGFYFLGLTQIARNNISEAKKNLIKASELVFNWADPHLKLAQLYAISGDDDLALDESSKVLRIQPSNVTALLITGVVQLKKGELNTALANFKQAKQLDPKNPAPSNNIGAIYLLQKNYSEAIKEYEDALMLAPDQIEALSAIAQTYLIQGNSKAAMDRVQQQLTKTKQPAAIYQLMGQLSLAAQDYSKAIEYLEKALNINPDLMSAYYVLGSAYAKQNKFESAINEYRTMIKKDPRAVAPYMMIGTLLDLQKQHMKANEYYEKALDINPGFALAANNLAWNYAEYGGNLDVALGLAQKAREADPNSPGIADTLGWIQLKKGLYRSALDLLKESSEKFKNSNSTVLYHLGVAYQKNDQLGPAREALERSLTLNANFSQASEAKSLLDQLKRKSKVG